jgi:AbiTii
LKISQILETEPLSKALRRALTLAQERKADEFVRWLQLELDGYYPENRAMTSGLMIPKYRTVVGAHYNDFGQRFQPPAELWYVNEMRLRNGVESLESLRDSRQTIVLQDTNYIELFAKHLDLQVSTFHFDRSEIIGVLSQIRSELFRQIQGLNSAASPTQEEFQGTKKEEVLMLSPNFNGIGIHLRPLWHRLKPKKH